MRSTNATAARGAIGSTFFTIAYGVIDSATGDIAWREAGIRPCSTSRPAGACESTTPRARPLESWATPMWRRPRHPRPGDRLIVASDGMIEAFGGEGLLDKAPRALERLRRRLAGREARGLRRGVQAPVAGIQREAPFQGRRKPARDRAAMTAPPRGRSLLREARYNA
jgi:serine phosphatase RsbU (regulator of sigma subunit)